MACVAEGYDTSFGRRVRVRNTCTNEIVGSGYVDFPTAQYKIDHGYFTCECPKPVISYVQAAVSFDNKKVRLSWNQNISGNVKITKNGVVIRQGGYPAGDSFIDEPISPGTHTLCVEAT